ncbi:divalent-cation tolerance protein CutA [Opitutus sp. ER46]|uniref:divalent-cation tolerance protein CutA n=1 Tax=Opitutus sp. ER46 TaxID=2161864 RepID=UPI000D2FA490|nr:divalent-cation tolerance protein CutA [Opitutus sp. ER46]PTX98938.1 divalent-cation tolerance protein CutA [Opitutus sp. ER46]
MLLAWTTVGSLDDANRLARDVIARKLAVCVQIEGPITSHYRWEDKTCEEQEFRLCFKFLEEQHSGLQQHVLAHHPYDTPEWIVVTAEYVAEKFLSWAKANSTNPPL